MIASEMLEAAGHEEPVDSVNIVVQALRGLNTAQRERITRAMETYIKAGTTQALSEVWQVLETTFPWLTKDPKEFAIEDPNRLFEGHWIKVVSDVARWKQVLSKIGGGSD